MRLEKFNNVDEVMEYAIKVFMYHAGQSPMNWTPSRQNVYYSLNNTFPKKIMAACDCLPKLGEDNLLLEINPSQYIKATHSFQVSAKTSDIDVNEIVKYFMILVNYGTSLRRYNFQDIIANENYLNFIKLTDKVTKQKVAILNASLRAFSETLYCDDHAVGGDMYGPHYIDGKGTLIVRKYNRLRPIEIYPSLCDLKIKAINTYCIYKDVNIDIDFIGNMICENSMVDSLLYFCIEIVDTDNNSNYIDEQNIDTINLLLEKWLFKIITEYKQMTDEEKKLLVLTCAYYTFKPMFENAKIDWCPTKDEIEIYLNFNKNKTKYGESENIVHCKNKDEVLSIVKDIVDPRIKWR